MRSKFTKENGYYVSSAAVTSSRCADINIRLSNSGFSDQNFRSVKVCFYESDGTTKKYCQSSFKTAYVGQWKAIATDVKDGVTYRFHFSGSLGSVSGCRAH